MPIDDEVEEYTCASCDYTTTNEDDLCFVEDSLLCEDCRSWCDNCEEYMSNDSSHYVEGVGDYCESCWENNTCYCERCSNTYPDSVSQYHIEDRGEYWCEGCYEHEGSYCEDCDQYFSRECEGCGEGSSGRSNLIHQYSYKPSPHFFGDDKHNLYFGLELEMEIRSGNLRESAQYIQSKVGDSIYLKDDSSIGRGGYAGFELVSHPLSFGHWTSQMSNLWEGLEYLRDNEQARSWDADNCGIHIHTSRAGFKSGAHTHRWLTLIYKNAPEMMKFAGRKSDYAKFNDVWQYDEYDRPYFSVKHKLDGRSHTERYSAVNTQNEHTLELRFFRGTTRPSGVLSAIELAHASIEYTRDMTLADVKLGMLKWDWFYDYVETNNGFYPNLYERMSKVSHISLKNIEMINA
jgi:hypothetical protein